ncbi:MAG: response regulator transcription factor [Fimbriimonadaceae bacterium]|nr:response regulator transcription factor [Fimbriimonadaceae bacterium]
MKILLVDDEATILETIGQKLRKEGFSVFAAASAEEGMRLYKQVRPDLIVLDVMLPNRSGFDLCRVIRKESHTPIIFLSARGSESDRLLGLELGADDYVVKPFNLRELAARVKAVLRRVRGETPLEIAESGDLRVDPRTHMVTMGVEEIEMAPKEFALLYFMVRNSGKVFTRDQLLDRVWGQDAFVTSRTVDVHVRWLRSRLEADPSNPKRLLTVRGVGYKFAG